LVDYNVFCTKRKAILSKDCSKYFKVTLSPEQRGESKIPLFWLVMRNQRLLLKQGPFVQMAILGPDWEFYEVIHGTPTVPKRDPRHNFMKNIVSIELLVKPLYMINM
jgi:hypothetical protein